MCIDQTPKSIKLFFCFQYLIFGSIYKNESYERYKLFETLIITYNNSIQIAGLPHVVQEQLSPHFYSSTIQRITKLKRQWRSQ